MGYLSDQPGIYSISVSGMLDPSWSDRLGGLTIVNTAGKDESRIANAVLTGRLVDQAALIGVLNTLYDYGYTLLWVQKLDPE